MSRRGDPRGTGNPKGTQGDPRGTQGDPREDPRGPKGELKGTQGDPRGPKGTQGDPRGPKATKSDYSCTLSETPAGNRKPKTLIYRSKIKSPRTKKTSN